MMNAVSQVRAAIGHLMFVRRRSQDLGHWQLVVRASYRHDKAVIAGRGEEAVVKRLLVLGGGTAGTMIVNKMRHRLM